MERQSKGIWFPIEIWEAKDLSWNEKILLLEIDSFTSSDKDCFISNEYISNLLDVTETTANKILSSLIKKGYVIKTAFDGRRRYVKSALTFTTNQGCSKEQGSLAEKSNILNTSTCIDILKEKEIDKSISKKKDRNVFDVREDLSYVKETFVQIWNEWLDYKDEIKKQYKTQRGANSQYNSLVKYANNNPILANAIVKQSIEHSWDGLFALTDKQVELFLSQKSPYYVDNNNEQETTPQSSEQVIINGQIYR